MHFFLQGLRARDKELYTLQMDIYEMKCHLLKILDPAAPLPRRPKDKPLPLLDIEEPTPPILAGGKWQALFNLLPGRKKLSPASEKRRKTEVALKGVAKFKDLLRRRIHERRAAKAGYGPSVTFHSSTDTDRTKLLSQDDEYDSDFEEIEMSEVGSTIGED